MAWTAPRIDGVSVTIYTLDELRRITRARWADRVADLRSAPEPMPDGTPDPRSDAHISVAAFQRTWDLLGDAGCHSLYHRTTGRPYGGEPVSTYFQSKDANSGFFIDHAFVSGALLPPVGAMEYGDRAAWRDASDHVPVILDLDLDPR